MSDSASTPPSPWWKFGHMWLVIAGPLIVVLASIVTIYLAVRTPDPVYGDASRGAARSSQAKDGGDAGRMSPAMQARNHAATGGVARPAPNHGTGPNQ